MPTQKHLKDPKVTVVTLQEFFLANDYLRGIAKKDLWDGSKPKINGKYFSITSSAIALITYGRRSINFGTEFCELLDHITVAYRDGTTEYILFERELDDLQKQRAQFEQNIELDEKIKQTVRAQKRLPPYSCPITLQKRDFSSCLVDTGYKTDKQDLKNKYVVFDVETNGTRTASDDLLSLSIYDPDTGICYNRYLPLDLQPVVLTTYIHGITDEALLDATHMDQSEINQLIEVFHLKDKVLLSYSGGSGLFDKQFVVNYCKRHGLVGFEDFKYENIKNTLPPTPYESQGRLSKDNMCTLLSIEGVKEIHTSYDDCLLQWKLFEKTAHEQLLFIKNHLFKYHPGYVIPCSFLIKNPRLAAFAGITIPLVEARVTEIFKLPFAKNVLRAIRKFPTNITGLSVEHIINTLLQVEEQDNKEFLKHNRSYLEYIGSLEKNINTIPIIKEKDGTLTAIKEEDSAYINSVNAVTKTIAKQLQPLVKYLKKKIFKQSRIMSQEMILSEDGKVLALCDLSDENNVVEIKTSEVILNDCLSPHVAMQLYYQVKGRNAYVLSIKFDEAWNLTMTNKILNDLNVYLYKVDLKASYVRTRVLQEYEIDILKAISDNPSVTMTDLSKQMNCSVGSITNTLAMLEKLGYLKKNVDPLEKTSWIILRSWKDVTTHYTYNGENILVAQE